VKGSLLLYSSMVTSSDEAFASNITGPPSEKEYKPKVKGPKYLAAAIQKKITKIKKNTTGKMIKTTLPMIQMKMITTIIKMMLIIKMM